MGGFQLSEGIFSHSMIKRAGGQLSRKEILLLGLTSIFAVIYRVYQATEAINRNQN